MESKAINKKTFLENLTYYILIVVLCIMALNLISQKSDKAYNIIKYRSYVVLSGSMEPKLYPGDLIITFKSNPKKLKVGDIITFKSNNQVITHRIEQINENGYITKGDNNDVVDEEIVKEDDIIGKVLFKIPKVGYVSQFLSQSWVIGVELILMGVFILINIKSQDNRND